LRRYILDMCKTLLWLRFRHLATIAHLRISLEPVSYFSMALGTSKGIVLAVKVWDTVGEDQTLKGEYKVISGRMYVFSVLLECDRTLTVRQVMTWNGMGKVSA
jgi:hypothetical protein